MILGAVCRFSNWPKLWSNPARTLHHRATHPRYTRGSDFLCVLALYATALAAERLDHQVFGAGGWISGHTVKHVLAAVAAAWLSRMLRLRSPTPAESAP